MPAHDLEKLVCPPLVVDQIQIWLVDLDERAQNGADGNQYLSPDEAERARRLVIERTRHRFIAARGTLRAILAHYLGSSPQEIGLVAGREGKPGLAGRHISPEIPPLEFNMSHTDRWAIYGVTRGCPVGIDIEQIRPLSQMQRVASRYFSAREYHAWQRLPTDQQSLAFYRLWTRKEAYLKGLGCGFRRRPNSFDVTSDVQRVSYVPVHDPAMGTRQWLLHDIDPLPGIVGSLAVEANDRLPSIVWVDPRRSTVPVVGASGPVIFAQ